MMMQSDLTDEQKRECQALEAEVQNEARQYGDFLTYTNVVWTDVQKALDDHSVAVEFICSDTEDGKTHYSAEVLRKGMEKPYHLSLFTVTKDELTRGAEKGTFNDFALKNIWPERLLKLFHPGDNVYFAPSGALHMLPIEYMMMNAMITKYVRKFGKNIIFSGFRDAELAQRLTSMGFIVHETTMPTADTYALLVPNMSFTSNKVRRAQNLGVMIVPVNEFVENIDKYI